MYKSINRESIILELMDGVAYKQIAEKHKCSLSTVGKIAQANGLGRIRYDERLYTAEYKRRFAHEWDEARFRILRAMGKCYDRQ